MTGAEDIAPVRHDAAEARSAGARARIWWLAIRPATLTASVVPVLIGSAIAARAGGFDFAPALAALAGALLIQIGTNLVNDVADFERGADTAERRGPARATQSGQLSPAQVRAAAWGSFAAAAVIGVYLIAHAGWPVATLGAVAIASGWAYTAGPWPLAYHGLGELFVFIFFGVAAVAGTVFVQTGSLDALTLAASLPPGALASAILVVNNIRDIATDRAAGKRTLAVRLGPAAAHAGFVLLIVVAYAVPPLLWFTGAPAAVLLPWLTLPRAVSLTARMARADDGAAFNAALRDTAKLHLAFGLLFGLGLLA